MKLPKFFPKNTDSETDSNEVDNFVSVDLTPSSVKSIFLSRDTESKMSVKGVSTRDTHKSKIRGSTVKAAIEECFEQAGIESSEAIIGLSGPKVMGFLLIGKVNRDDPDEEISEKEMGKIYDKVKSAAYKQAKQRWNTFFAEDAEFETLDLVVTDIFVDDNKVESAEGETGESIQVSVFCSYAETEYYHWAVSTLESAGFSTITVTTTNYSQAKLLSEQEKNFILIDIGKDHTDLAVIFGGNIIQTRSFEFGGSYFTDHISTKMGLDYMNANGKKEAFCMKTLPEEEMDKFSDYMYESGKDWRLAMSTVLESISGIKSFPKRIFLTGGSANVPIIEELLYEEEWRQSIPFSGEIEVEQVNSDLWRKYVMDNLNILNSTRMFAPASLAVIKLELTEDE